jgi:hypothetical protein
MKKKHPLLNDKPTGTLPKRTPSLYMEDLMKRSEKALKKLKRIFDK